MLHHDPKVPEGRRGGGERPPRRGRRHRATAGVALALVVGLLGAPVGPVAAAPTDHPSEHSMDPIDPTYPFVCTTAREGLGQPKIDNQDGQGIPVAEEDENGDYPIWDVKVQIMPVAEAENYRWNPFDLTKVWSKKDYPRIDVGYFVLNRNPHSHFAQIEQIALDPGNLVPGIGFSPDRMLQARIFAYADQQRYRIGPNYRDLPINRPIDDVNTYSREGHMAYEFEDATQPSYSPNRYDKGAGYLDNGEDSSSGVTYGEATDTYVGADNHGTDLVRAAYVQHPEDGDFVQAGTLYREVFDDAAKERIANNIAGAMEGVSPEVEERVYWYWSSVDENLGNRVREIYTADKNK